MGACVVYVSLTGKVINHAKWGKVLKSEKEFVQQKLNVLKAGQWGWRDGQQFRTIPLPEDKFVFQHPYQTAQN